MNRQHCSHKAGEACVLIITWCTRCSGWRVMRVSSHPVSSLDQSTFALYESHFLPVEETSPDELQHLIQRAFRSAQEWEQDNADQGVLDF